MPTFADHEIAAPPTPPDALSPLTAGQRARLERDSEEARLTGEVADLAVARRRARAAYFDAEDRALPGIEELREGAKRLEAAFDEACDRLIAFRESEGK